MNVDRELARLPRGDLEKVYKKCRIKYMRSRFRLHPPVAFALRTCCYMFALLLILPHHPMSMVIAFGGGLSFALII